MGRLDGKTALITGGGSGIGRATAELFLAEGCRVVIGDINADSIAAVLDAAGAGAPITGVQGDVSDMAAAARLVEEAVRVLGGLDILVCAAGITSRSRISRLSEEEFDRVIGVNLKGIYTVVSAALPALTAGGGGTIVTVGSEMGLVGEPNAPVYNASKAGVIMFTKSIALDLIAQNVRVNTICPGITQTPLLEEELRIAEDPGGDAGGVRPLGADRPRRRSGRAGPRHPVPRERRELVRGGNGARPRRRVHVSLIWPVQKRPRGTGAGCVRAWPSANDPVVRSARLGRAPDRGYNGSAGRSPPLPPPGRLRTSPIATRPRPSPASFHRRYCIVLRYIS